MALTTTEEALVRQLLDQQAAILSLAGNESTITSKLSATKVTLADLVAASSLTDTDLLLTRQGTNDKSITAALVKTYSQQGMMDLVTNQTAGGTKTFSSSPSVPTASQHDDSEKSANTTFVRRNGIRSSDVTNIIANTVLTAADLGKTFVLYGGSGFAVTLPSLATCPSGTRLEFMNFNVGTVVVSRAGTDIIFASSSSVTSFSLRQGDTLTLVSRGDYWFAVSGSVQHALSQTAIENYVPTGAVSYFAMSSPPSGWIKANGAVLNRVTYSRLFTAIGTTFGAGDGSTTFQLPDLRGEFLRAWDDGRGVDSGRVFGTAQTANTPRDAMYRVDNISSILNFANGSMVSGAVVAVATLLAANTVENRPRNVALLPCIKY